MNRTLSTLGVTGLLVALLVGCDAPNDVMGTPPLPQVCMASDTAEVQIGVVTPYQNEFIQPLTGKFAIDSEVHGRSTFSCVEDGDKIRYLWRRPGRSVAARNEIVVNSDFPGDWLQDFTFTPNLDGEWTLEVFRNDAIVATVRFTVG